MWVTSGNNKDWGDWRFIFIFSFAEEGKVLKMKMNFARSAPCWLGSPPCGAKWGGMHCEGSRALNFGYKEAIL